jgi:hypothetical protein
MVKITILGYWLYSILGPVQNRSEKIRLRNSKPGSSSSLNAGKNLPGNPRSQEIIAGWVGHSTVLINLSGTTVLTDPNFSRRIKILRRIVDLPLEP